MHLIGVMLGESMSELFQIAMEDVSSRVETQDFATLVLPPVEEVIDGKQDCRMLRRHSKLWLPRRACEKLFGEHRQPVQRRHLLESLYRAEVGTLPSS